MPRRSRGSAARVSPDGFAPSTMASRCWKGARSAPAGRSAPEDLVIRTFYRFEGVSDPDDMAIVYAIETLDESRRCSDATTSRVRLSRDGRGRRAYPSRRGRRAVRWPARGGASRPTALAIVYNARLGESMTRAHRAGARGGAGRLELTHLGAAGWEISDGRAGDPSRSLPVSAPLSRPVRPDGHARRCPGDRRPVFGPDDASSPTPRRSTPTCARGFHPASRTRTSTTRSTCRTSPGRPAPP